MYWIKCQLGHNFSPLKFVERADDTGRGEPDQLIRIEGDPIERFLCPPQQTFPVRYDVISIVVTKFRFECKATGAKIPYARSHILRGLMQPARV